MHASSSVTTPYRNLHKLAQALQGIRSLECNLKSYDCMMNDDACTTSDCFDHFHVL